MAQPNGPIIKILIRIIIKKVPVKKASSKELLGHKVAVIEQTQQAGGGHHEHRPPAAVAEQAVKQRRIEDQQQVFPLEFLGERVGGDGR